jgi:small-conductance mechanosensitive channel
MMTGVVSFTIAWVLTQYIQKKIIPLVLGSGRPRNKARRKISRILGITCVYLGYAAILVIYQMMLLTRSGTSTPERTV